MRRGDGDSTGPPWGGDDDGEAQRLREKAEAEAATAALVRETRLRLLAKRIAQEQAAETEAMHQIVAAVLSGTAHLADVSPDVLRSPRALEALALARTVQDMLLQCRLDEAANEALEMLTARMRDPDTKHRDRITAAQTVLSARAKMGGAGSQGQDALASLRAMLSRERQQEDISKLTDAELEARLRRTTLGKP